MPPPQFNQHISNPVGVGPGAQIVPMIPPFATTQQQMTRLSSQNFVQNFNTNSNGIGQMGMISDGGYCQPPQMLSNHLQGKVVSIPPPPGMVGPPNVRFVGVDHTKVSSGNLNGIFFTGGLNPMNPIVVKKAWNEDAIVKSHESSLSNKNDKKINKKSKKYSSRSKSISQSRSCNRNNNRSYENTKKKYRRNSISYSRSRSKGSRSLRSRSRSISNVGVGTNNNNNQKKDPRKIVPDNSNNTNNRKYDNDIVNNNNNNKKKNKDKQRKKIDKRRNIPTNKQDTVNNSENNNIDKNKSNASSSKNNLNKRQKLKNLKRDHYDSTSLPKNNDNNFNNAEISPRKKSKYKDQEKILELLGKIKPKEQKPSIKPTPTNKGKRSIDKNQYKKCASRHSKSSNFSEDLNNNKPINLDNDKPKNKPSQTKKDSFAKKDLTSDKTK